MNRSSDEDQYASGKRIGHGAAIMAVGTAISRLTGVARLFALAYALGFNRVADAYNLANTTPNIVHDLVIGGVLSATFIPVFVERFATRDPKTAREAVSAVTTLSIVIVVVASGLLALLAPGVVHLYTISDHSRSLPQERAVATLLLRLFAPQLCFYGLISIATALLNSKNRFGAPMFVPIVNNLTTIFVLLSLAAAFPRPSLQGVSHNMGFEIMLGLGTTLGVGLQALALVPSLRRAHLGIRWLWQPSHEAVRSIVKLSGWTFALVVANQATLFVVLTLAVGQHGGAVTSYSYAYTFFQLPFGIAAISIMSAFTPELARSWSLGERRTFHQNLAKGLKATIATMVPAAVGYLLLARPLVALILAHGVGSSGAGRTASTLAMLALGLPGFAVYLFLIRAFQAMQDMRSAFWLYLVENGANLVLAFVLVRTMGVEGLGLALGIAYTAAAIVAVVHMHRSTGGIGGHGVARSATRVFASSFIMAAVVAMTNSLFSGRTVAELALELLTSVLAGIGAYIASASVGGWMVTVGQRRRERSEQKRRRFAAGQEFPKSFWKRK
ncbi:MAG: murein biosynthesis integral membrane protein MurJ [Acidimicrobiales bacterium]